jgi:hypothetical protein
MMKLPDSDRSPLIVGLLVALGWVVAHLVIQIPRGWPFYGPGEWDVLLVAAAIANGQPPHATVAALHGYEMGVYLVALPVAFFRVLGVEMVLAAKLAAMMFGASTVAVVAGLATATARGILGRGGVVAGLLAGWVLIVAWPDWHAVAANLDGSTRHAALPQLLAVACMRLAWRRDSLRWSAASGAFAGVAWFISSVSLWTLLLALGTGLVLLRSHGAGRCLRHVAAVTAGTLGWIVLYVVLIPGGLTGVGGFLSAHPSWIGPVFSGGSGPPSSRVDPVGPLYLLSHVPEALQGMGGVAPTRLIRWASAGLVGLILSFSMLRAAVAGFSRKVNGLDFLALVGASWLIPLSYLPETYRFYAPAYRFWAIPLCLCVAVLAVQAELLLAARGRHWVVRWSLVALLVVASLPSVSRLTDTVDFPDSSLSAGLVHAGMHRMGRRTVGIHATYWALSPHAPPEVSAALDQGYGLGMGFELAEELHPNWEADDGWAELADRFEPSRRHAILLGVGCGLGAALPSGTSVVPLVSLFTGLDRARLLTGLVRCSLRQETLGPSKDRAGFLGGLQLEAPDWVFISRTLDTSAATPVQRRNWLARRAQGVADGRDDSEGAATPLQAHEDLLPELFDAYPVSPPP